MGKFNSVFGVRTYDERIASDLKDLKVNVFHAVSPVNRFMKPELSVGVIIWVMLFIIRCYYLFPALVCIVISTCLITLHDIGGDVLLLHPIFHFFIKRVQPDVIVAHVEGIAQDPLRIDPGGDLGGLGIGATGGLDGGMAAVGEDGFDLLEIAAHAAGYEVIDAVVEAAEGNGLDAAQAQAGDFHIGIGGGLDEVGGPSTVSFTAQ